MRRRLTAIDYESILTYTREHGYGSVKKAAETFGVSTTLVVSIRSIYNAVMNDQQVPRSLRSNYKTCFEVVKQMKIKEQGKVYSPTVAPPSTVSSVNSVNSYGPDFICQYIAEQEKIIIELEEQLIKHKNNINIAKDFAARLS